MFKPVPAFHRYYPFLFSRVLDNDQKVRSFYPHLPEDEKSCLERAVFLSKGSFCPEVQKHLLVANSRQQGFSFSQPTKNKEEGNPLFIITGQQPGLLTGPLYVVYKALTAVKVAREAGQLLKRPVLPLFWVATEDHNMPAMARLFIAALQRGGPVKVRLSLPSFGLPAGMVPLTEQQKDLVLAGLDRLTPESGHKSTFLKLLREKTDGSANPGQWFMALMDLLFSGTGLHLFDPLQVSAKGLLIPLLLKALEKGPEIHRAVGSGEDVLKKAGLPLQVTRSGQETFLMMIWKERRYALWRQGGRYFTPRGELSVTKGELVKLIEKEPWRFSPNVLLRPVFQDMLFPNLAYIPGPGELAYYVQIREVYELFGLQPPFLYPRAGVTLVEPHLKRALEICRMTPEGAMEQFMERRRGRKASREESPALEMLRENFYPRSQLQERVFNIFPYLLKYGFAFWQDFVEHFPVKSGHYLYFLGKEDSHGA